MFDFKVNDRVFISNFFFHRLEYTPYSTPITMHTDIGYNTASHLFQPITVHLNPEPNRASTTPMLPSQSHHYPQPHVPNFRTQPSPLHPPPLASFASKDIRYDNRVGSRKSLYNNKNSPGFLRDEITGGIDVESKGFYLSQLDEDGRNSSPTPAKRHKRDSHSSGNHRHFAFK